MTNKEHTEGLKEIYKYVYTCDKCKTKYGSDNKETKEHVCPICEKDGNISTGKH